MKFGKLSFFKHSIRKLQRRDFFKKKMGIQKKL